MYNSGRCGGIVMYKWCRGGGIGRRARLKIVWRQLHESSILSRGTTCKDTSRRYVGMSLKSSLEFPAAAGPRTVAVANLTAGTTHFRSW